MTDRRRQVILAVVVVLLLAMLLCQWYSVQWYSVPTWCDLGPAAELRQACISLARSTRGVRPEVRSLMRSVCEQTDAPLPIRLSSPGCRKAVMYVPIGRLGNLMNLYAIIYSLTKTFGVQGFVEKGMWEELHNSFPNISLPPIADPPNSVKQVQNVTYQEVEAKLACHPGDAGDYRFYRIANYPDRNGIDLFHPFYKDLRQEYAFGHLLQVEVQTYLRQVLGRRTSATYIGFHIRRTDYKNYIETEYKGSLPGLNYFRKCLNYYRSRFDDALFIVCSDDMKFAREALRSEGDDIIFAGDRSGSSVASDMALLAACNHSIVTVGTYGFWSAYLAGGTVLVPKVQTHLSRGDRHADQLEIQLAGADNWIAIS